jgi:hypothetical protein
MEMSVSITNEPDFLLARATGRFSIESAKRTFLEICDAIVRYQSEKVLFDGTDLSGEPKIADRFDYGQFVAEETRKLESRGLGLRPRFAYVLLPPVFDPRKLGEIVAQNRGMNVNTFARREDAVAWLTRSPSGSDGP